MRFRVKTQYPLLTNHQFDEIDMVIIKRNLWEGILPAYGLYKIMLSEDDSGDASDLIIIDYAQNYIKFQGKDGPANEEIIYPY